MAIFVKGKGILKAQGSRRKTLSNHSEEDSELIIDDSATEDSTTVTSIKIPKVPLSSIVKPLTSSHQTAPTEPARGLRRVPGATPAQSIPPEGSPGIADPEPTTSPPQSELDPEPELSQPQPIAPAEVIPKNKKSEHADLLLWLPTRNSPGKLDRTLNMLYSTCNSSLSFDVQVIVDSDQEELYQQVKNKYVDNNIIWSYPDHLKNDFWNIIQAEFDFLENNDYYFAWMITDDFFKLSHGWDKEIIEKMGFFKDDLFTIHHSDPRNLFRGVGKGHGRHQGVFRVQYVRDNVHPAQIPAGRRAATGDPSSDIIWNYSECLPVSTKKWWMMMRQLYEPNYLTAQSEHLTAAIVMILCKEYNHNRLIPADFYWGPLVDNGNTHKTGVGDCGSRKALFTRWTKEEDFKVIRDVAKKMNDIIQKTDNTYDLERNCSGWANVYTGALHLRNDQGSWTIQEDEDKLIVINNLTGKKYKMMLEPLDDT